MSKNNRNEEQLRKAREYLSKATDKTTNTKIFSDSLKELFRRPSLTEALLSKLPPEQPTPTPEQPTPEPKQPTQNHIPSIKSPSIKSPSIPAKPLPNDDRCPEHLKHLLGTHWLRLEDLNIDRDEGPGTGYQRGIKLTPKELEQERFNPLICQVLDIALRPDGTYWIMDGQQRVTRAIYDGQEIIECKVTYSTGRQEESDRYVNINEKRKKMSPLELWVGDLIAREPQTIEIYNTITKHGYTMGGTKHIGIQCANTIKSIVKDTNVQTLDIILTIIKNTWPNTKNEIKLADYVFKALATIVKKNKHLTAEYAINKLKNKDLEVYIGNARKKQAMAPGANNQLPQHLAVMLINALNSRRSPSIEPFTI